MLRSQKFYSQYRSTSRLATGNAPRLVSLPGGRSLENSDTRISLPKTKTTVLVVDDDDVDLERIERLIGKMNLPINLVFARSGADAVQRISSSDIGLMLLDFKLGDMTGADVLSEIKKQKKASNIPVIMITGMGDEETAIQSIRHGVHDYLPKNKLNLDSLMSVLLSALHAAELEKKLGDTQDRLRRMSLFDTLTNLPNRNLFFDRLNQAIRSTERRSDAFSILMIDLNLFKEVNDNLGHAAGDKVLAIIGQRLLSTARKSDTIARLGGDEFACILHEVRNSDAAIACAEKFVAAISLPIAIGDRIIQVGASVGIAIYPLHGNDQSTLISNADHAMYSAKRSGHRVIVYTEKDGEETKSKLPISQTLFKAIKEREFYLEFQPKIDLNDGHIIGAETLVRWNSPEFGMVPPGNFIPIAERSSHIIGLSYLTIEMALDQVAQWRRQGINLPIALNISARMLDDVDFPNWLSGKIDCFHIEPKTITLEITETALSSSGAISQATLTKLNTAGFKLSIDDFGSGFTSFQSLRNVEISEIKIDRLYIHELKMANRDAQIIRSILSLAESLGMQAVAEGVETSEQWETLRTLGCRYAQGYGIAQPMTATALQNWLVSSSKLKH